MHLFSARLVAAFISSLVAALLWVMYDSTLTFDREVGLYISTSFLFKN